MEWNGKGYNQIDNEEFEIKNGKEKGKEYDYNDREFKGELLGQKRKKKCFTAS